MPRFDSDLLLRFERINRLYFNGQYKLRGLNWSNRPFNKTYRGYDCCNSWAFYTPKRRIYINVCLKGRCPLYVLDYLIYHECLHQYWYNHCQSFRTKERDFKHYAKAESWLKKHQKQKKAGRP